MTRRHKLIDEDRIRDRLVHLIRIPSITGVEDAAIGQVANWLQQTDAEIEYWNDGIASVQRDPRYPGHEVERAWVPVVAGVIRGQRPGPSVLLTGHVDVVPPGNYDLWQHEPFSGLVADDRIYGCGASDMKSGLVAALEAFNVFATGNQDFAGRVIFVAVPAEEDSGLGTLAAIRRDWCGDVAIVPEPTARDGVPELVIAHAGAMSLTIEVPGRSAHASKRHLGESALDHFWPIYRAIRKDEEAINAAEKHPLMTALSMPYASNIGRIEGGTWSSSVMDSLKVEVRIGVALDETVEDAEVRFRHAVEKAIAKDEWLRKNPPKISRKASGFGSAATPEDHPLVAALADAADSVFGDPPTISGAPYGCDMSGWVRHAKTPTVIYGPGDIDLAHAANEWVSLDTTIETTKTLVRAVDNLLELDVEALREQNAALYGVASQA
jgi:acetylornithine deacetylase